MPGTLEQGHDLFKADHPSWVLSQWEAGFKGAVWEGFGFLGTFP